MMKHMIVNFDELKFALIQGAIQYLEDRKYNSQKLKTGIWHSNTGILRAEKLLTYAQLVNIDDMSILALAFSIFKSSSSWLKNEISHKLFTGIYSDNDGAINNTLSSPSFNMHEVIEIAKERGHSEIAPDYLFPMDIWSGHNMLHDFKRGIHVDLSHSHYLNKKKISQRIILREPENQLIVLNQPEKFMGRVLQFDNALSNNTTDIDLSLAQYALNSEINADKTIEYPRGIKKGHPLYDAIEIAKDALRHEKAAYRFARLGDINKMLESVFNPHITPEKKLACIQIFQNNTRYSITAKRKIVNFLVAVAAAAVCTVIGTVIGAAIGGTLGIISGPGSLFTAIAGAIVGCKTGLTVGLSGTTLGIFAATPYTYNGFYGRDERNLANKAQKFVADKKLTSTPRLVCGQI